jgi:RNA polymerase primary sigma factor
MDSITTYYRDISKIKLLTKDEEVSLGKEILKGNLDAANKLAESNLRFAFFMAKKYQRTRLSLLELISCANLGLLIASRKFNYRKGMRFLTYAGYYIMRTIMSSAADENSTIRLPRSRHYNSPWVKRRIKKIKKATGEKNESVILEGIKNDNIITYVPIHGFYENDKSLDDIFLEKLSINSHGEAYEQKNVNNAIRDEILKLSEREQFILNETFFNDPPVTVEALSKVLEISASRVRAIKEAVYKKLKKSLKEILEK